MNTILIKKILYFIILLGLAFVSIFLFTIEGLHVVFSILFLVFVLAYSVIGFVYVSKADKGNKKEIKERASKYEINNKRCPKCGKPYDGETCFNCGFAKKE